MALRRGTTLKYINQRDLALANDDALICKRWWERLQGLGVTHFHFHSDRATEEEALLFELYQCDISLRMIAKSVIFETVWTWVFNLQTFYD